MALRRLPPGQVRTSAKNWFAGRYAPSAHHLIALAGKCDDVMEIFLMLTCRPELLLAAQLGSARRDLLGTLEKLHDLLTARE